MSYRSLITFLSLFALTVGFSVQAATVIINDEIEYQTIEGWGASSNFNEEAPFRLPDSLREAMFDLIFEDLGTNILCIRLYSSFQRGEGVDYNWDVMASQRRIINAALDRGTIDKIWIKVSSPPGWMKDNNDAAHGGHVEEEHYQDYADYLSAYIRGMQDEYEIPIDAVSIFNEPGFGNENVDYESTGTTPEEYRDILKVVGRTFDDDGLEDIVFMGSESGHITGNIGCLTAFLPVILEDSIAANYLGRISTHQYGDYQLLYGMGEADDWEGLFELADENSLNIWETEIFMGGVLESDDIHEGLYTALLIHTALTLGNVNAWHYWQYYWPAIDGNSTGIVEILQRGREAYEIAVYPRYYCIKQWAKNVPVGSIRIDAQSDNEDLNVTAFQNDGRTIIIAFNRTEGEIQADFRCNEIIGDITHIRTSDGENYRHQNEIRPDDNSFSVNITAASISTFIVPTGERGVFDQRIVPSNFNIIECFPNPFNSFTRLNFLLSTPGTVSLKVFSLDGRHITTLVEDNYQTGTHNLMWNPTGLPAGMYIIKGRLSGIQYESPVMLLK